MESDNETPVSGQEGSRLPAPTGDDSEERLRFLASIVDGTDDAVIGKDLDATIRSWNPGAARLYGYTPDEIVGKNFSVLVPPERADELADIMARLKRGEHIHHLETVRLARDGRRRDVEVTLSPIRDTTGAITGCSSIARDTCERRRYERALRESEARKAAVLEVALDCIVTMDIEGRVVEWNPAAEQTFGYTRDEALGQPVADLIVPPALRDRHQAGLAHHRETGKGPFLGRRLELTGMRNGGEEFPVEIAIVPLAINGGTLFTAYLRDITERQRARRAQDELALVVAGARCLLWHAEVVDVPGHGLHWDLHFADEAAALRFFPIAVTPGEDFAAAWDRSRVTEKRAHNDASAALHVRAGEDYSQEYQCVRADGTDFWMREDVQVVAAGRGRWHLVGVSMEITERVRAEQERERLLGEVQAAALRQRAVLRDVLHSVTDRCLCLCDGPDDLPAPLAPVGDAIPLTQLGDLRAVRQRIALAVRERGFPEDRVQDLQTAGSEAAMNATVHAGAGEARVLAGADTVQVWVEDRGSGIALEHLPRATLEKGFTTAGTLGMGMKLMLQTVDRLFLLTGELGTTIVLEQDRSPSVSPW